MCSRTWVLLLMLILLWAINFGIATKKKTRWTPNNGATQLDFNRLFGRKFFKMLKNEDVGLFSRIGLKSTIFNKLYRMSERKSRRVSAKKMLSFFIRWHICIWRLNVWLYIDNIEWRKEMILMWSNSVFHTNKHPFTIWPRTSTCLCGPNWI